MLIKISFFIMKCSSVQRLVLSIVPTEGISISSHTTVVHITSNYSLERDVKKAEVNYSTIRMFLICPRHNKIEIIMRSVLSNKSFIRINWELSI
jgi:hypothetical protein